MVNWCVTVLDVPRNVSFENSFKKSLFHLVRGKLVGEVFDVLNIFMLIQVNLDMTD